MITSKSLIALAERHSIPIRPGRTESHTAETLSRRILAPIATCHAFIASGALTPTELMQGGASGTLCFNSDQLNAVRRMVALSIVAKTVELSTGNAGPIHLAANHALNTNAAQFNANPKTTELARYIAVEDEKPSLVGRVAKTGAVVAAGAAAVGGGAWLRGRAALGVPRSGKLGFGRTAVIGGRKLISDADRLRSGLGRGLDVAGDATKSAATAVTGADGRELLRRAKLAMQSRRQ